MKTQRDPLTGKGRQVDRINIEYSIRTIARRPLDVAVHRDRHIYLTGSQTVMEVVHAAERSPMRDRAKTAPPSAAVLSGRVLSGRAALRLRSNDGSYSPRHPEERGRNHTRLHHLPGGGRARHVRGKVSRSGRRHRRTDRAETAAARRPHGRRAAELAWYVAFFAVRVPRFRRWLNETETARRKLHDREHLRSAAQLQELVDKSDLSETERAEASAELMFEMLKTEDYIVTVGPDYGVRLLMEAGSEMMPTIHDLFWIIGHAAEGSELITSDNPLVQIGSNEAMTFPIAADAALMLMQSPSGKIHNYDKDMSPDIVHATNLATATESERLVIGRDEDYLRRVVEEAGIIGKEPARFADIGPPPTTDS